jgi:hypothetical protein
MFEIWGLRKLFGSTRYELTGEWRKLHTDELHHMYLTPNTDWEMISRMRCKGHVTILGRGGEGEMHIGFW